MITFQYEDEDDEYNSRGEFDDDHSLGNDSGVSSNENDQNIIGETVKSVSRNDDFASNDNGLDILDEAANDIVLPSTSAQAKKLWFDMKTLQHEDAAKSYLKENYYAITRSENRTTKIKHTYTRCN